MSVNELVEQWLFEYACRHCLYTTLNGKNIFKIVQSFSSLALLWLGQPLVICYM